MSFNTEQIVQEIRAGFESMMVLVQEGKNATADEIERDVFRQVLDLGGQLMQLFFALRSELEFRVLDSGLRQGKLGETPLPRTLTTEERSVTCEIR